MGKYIMALLFKQGSQSVINSTLESFKRAMNSTISIVVSGIIVAGIILYSLIQLLKQFEIFILQNFENGESLLTMTYGIITILGLVTLFLLFSKSKSNRSKRPEVEIKHEPLEGIISGFISGFYSGLKGQKEKPLRIIKRGA